MMSTDALTTPLGINREAAKAERKALPWAKIGAGLCGALLVGAGCLAILKGDRLGGEPVVVVAIERVPGVVSAQAPAQPAEPPLSPNVREVPRQPADRQNAAELENDAGVRVNRGGNAGAPGAVVIRVPDAQPSIRLAPAPDKRLIERGRHGSLPKISAEGLRPADVYARPVTSQQKVAPARVAIVIGGLGIGQTTTADAIQKLPGAVSLAFAPYGADLERQVSRARENGHEVLLQTPMEPFDYPDNDPGPQTLVTTLPPEQNIDRLHWVLSRFPGYVGVINFMGGRFTSNDASLAPVMKELGQRGLLFVDDGSSGRTLAPQTAAGAGVSAAKADVVLDAVQRAAEIDAALARLEKIAREKGSAVGYAAALPVTVERLQRWAKAAEARGITLVPVSALVTSPRRS
ncbi:MAG: divergent polysaccharide deacetylase family protein [Beijerinckiaceae bacterium]